MLTLFQKLTTLPETLRTDGGSEFTNKLFQSFLKKNTIRHYIARNDSKAALAERVIQTLKRKIYQQMVYKNTPEYISTLSDIVKSYNKTIHSNMGYAPNSVTDDNAHEVRLSRYLRTKKKKALKFKFNVDDKVRVSYTHKPFDRVYDIHFSGEIFTVFQRKKSISNIPVYKLADMAGDVIIGTFYNEELQKAYVTDDTVYKIEKVLKKRTYRGTKQVYGKWLY